MILLKLIAMLLRAALSLLQWVLIFILHFSTWVFHLISGFLFLSVIVSLLLGHVTWSVAIPGFILSFCIYMIPRIGEWITIQIMSLHSILWDFIHNS